MTDYKAIKGKTILNIASDLDNPEGEGQIWFNTTSSDFKTISLAAGAWATGGTMNTARRSGSVGADDADAATFVGGSSDLDECEQYDGSSWTEVADLNTGRTGTGGGGTKASMITCAGQHTARVAIVEEWDDSSWTEIADVNTARNEGVGFSGTVDSAILFGGETPSASALAETWNGTSWTETGDLNTARGRIGAATEGTVTATLGFGGAPNLNVSETWNGTSWTEGNNLNTARQEMGGGGISTAAIGYGGHSGANDDETEEYDGTSWSEKADLNTARRHCTTGGGTQNSVICTGGEAPALTNTEEWAAPASVQTVAFD